MRHLASLVCIVLFGGFAFAAEKTADLKNLSLSGGIDQGKARLIIEGWLNGGAEQEKSAFATTAYQSIRVDQTKLGQTISLTFDIVTGSPKEFALSISGDGEIRQVTGEQLQDWSVRQDEGAKRTLVLRPKKADKPVAKLSFTVSIDQELRNLPAEVKPLALTPAQTALFNGFVKIESAPEISVQPAEQTGLVPLNSKYLPENLRASGNSGDSEPFAFRFQGAAYNLSLRVSLADPEARGIVLRDFQLQGELHELTATFELTAHALVRNTRGARLDLLSGELALTEYAPNQDWRLQFDQGKYQLVCDHPGEFPIRLKFEAKVHRGEATRSWRSVDFRVAPAVLQPLIVRGVPADTQFEFPGAARPERTADQFKTFLPSDGTVKLSWKESLPESEGKLFYAAEMLSQVSVAPGLMRQVALLDFKVMQGELSRLSLTLKGEGEVTRISGTDVLAWNIEPIPGSQDRRVIIQFNQAQKDRFNIQLQVQTPLGAFPQVADLVQIQPEAATRFTGYFRVTNEGAVRLEVTSTSGVSQISPEKFPESDVTRATLRPAGSQRFAYRFSGADFSLNIQADQIQPELGVSEVLAYRAGETELSIDAELELDIREAPVRELLLNVPKGFAVSTLNVAGLSDYFLKDLDDHAELRLILGQPVSGRQVLQLRLERNLPLGQESWVLPRVELVKAKSVRGHVAVAADAGFRVTPQRTQGLTEIATAFFPRKLAGIQSAFRLNDSLWQATLRLERLPQTIQVDALHLFSIGEGVAYGSSVLNYNIAGAPVSAFRVELSEEYFNVEFTGKDIRNWQKTDNGFLVQLHSPVSGPYTLLATYERPFKAQADTLAFTGARPLGTQSDQGYTVIISAYQFQVKPIEISPALLPLETREVPPEYRLFFDAPVLAAYRYNSRPFALKLALAPLAQGESLSLLVDRAALKTKISKEGQVLTEARYFVKNRGNPHLRLKLPNGAQLWSTSINGNAVVPVLDKGDHLVPLPQTADPNAVLTLDLKLGSKSSSPERLSVAAPILGCPVMLADWKLEPDAGQRLRYRAGSLTPAAGVADDSGFAQLARALRSGISGEAAVSLLAAFVLIVLATLMWRWAASDEVYRLSARHVIGGLAGLLALLVSIVLFSSVIHTLEEARVRTPGDLAFLAPVQQAGSALSVDVSNVPDRPSVWKWVGYGWPVLVALAIWFYGWLAEDRTTKRMALITGWTILAWAALRAPNGASVFLALILFFLVLHVLIPALRRLFLVPDRPQPAPASAAAGAAAATLLLIGGLLWVGCTTGNAASSSSKRSPRALPVISSPANDSEVPTHTPTAEFVLQNARVQDKYASVSAKIKWSVEKGQLMPLLFEPAVLTAVNYPSNALKLVETSFANHRTKLLVAEVSGVYEVELTYELEVLKKDGESGINLGTQHGLINELNLTLVNLDVDVVSPQAVSIRRESSGSNTVARIVLAASEAWIGWKPRTRDAQREKAVFYSELSQLFVPTAGMIEGAHYVSIRPAQGQLSELVLSVPAGATITDVLDANKPPGQEPTTNTKASNPIVSLWRFDPDSRKLRVTLTPPQSRPFAILVRSQLATGSLPFEKSTGLLTVAGTAGEIGLVGLGSGNEVQLENTSAAGLSPINLEDFPAEVLAALQAQISGLTLRRAYRYADASATVLVGASAVEPDVRVDSQDTVSLGEDRVVLAANSSVEITRAGIFRLSFVLPAGFDVESISSLALSHWTELANDTGRVITLNLTGKTEGKQQFTINVAGPGLRATNSWLVPQLAFREASKQRGTLLLVPEQGLRLQVLNSEGVTQLDPQKSGIKQKGVLAFRVLQTPRTLALAIEQVNPWTQVTTLQHATVAEAQVKIAANLQYQIENTGVKGFRVLIPTNAESVRFSGEQIADFLPVAGSVTNDMQLWEIKLHRRIIGSYLLQASWQTRLPENANDYRLRGIQALEVNLQRGFVTVQAAGRLQLRLDAAPEALQPAEWQSIPRSLQQGVSPSTANFTFRLIETDFQLPIGFQRHEAAKLLPARVNSLTFNSVISDEGVMLTQAHLELVPGDERLLRVRLPEQGRFWLAFVNQNGVWPWQQTNQILVPLEKQSRPDAPIPVDILYTCSVGKHAEDQLNLELLAPRFELPLENITWHVSLSEKWKVTKWSGALQLQQQQVASLGRVDLGAYLQTEMNDQRQRTKKAEELLAAANSAIQTGDPQQARRDFQAAYGLSTHDAAFNEDARVQLHNIKLQQALIGLNVRQAGIAGEPGPAAGKLRELKSRKEFNYTQQDAKEIIDRNTEDENATLMRLAERLIQQQDAAVTTPAALRANIPEQGRMLTFTRAVAVDPWADLRLELKATAISTVSWGLRLAILAMTILVLALFSFSMKPARQGGLRD